MQISDFAPPPPMHRSAKVDRFQQNRYRKNGAIQQIDDDNEIVFSNATTVVQNRRPGWSYRANSNSLHNITKPVIMRASDMKIKVPQFIIEHGGKVRK
jgi:hypothetical protein